MILDTTSKTIELILGSAKTTNDCEYTADYVDTVSGTTFVPIGTLGLTNGLTAVTAVTAPAGSVQRHVKALTVYNADTVNSVVTVRMYDGTNRRVIMKVTLTPGQTLVFSPEAGWNIMQSLVGQIPGTATNDNAAAGNIGEKIQSNVLLGSAISLSNGVATNITSIVLTPGDWDINGVVWFNGGTTTTVSEIIGGASTSSAAFDVRAALTGSRTTNVLNSTTPFTQDAISLTINPFTLQVSVNTTVFLLATAIFGVSTCTAFGNIIARRAR